VSNEERERFLADLHVGVIAVERPEGAPLAVPIWYAYEPGGEVSIWTTEGTLKDKLIRAAGRFSFTVQDEQPPYALAEQQGIVGVGHVPLLPLPVVAPIVGARTDSMP